MQFFCPGVPPPFIILKKIMPSQLLQHSCNRYNIDIVIRMAKYLDVGFIFSFNTFLLLLQKNNEVVVCMSNCHKCKVDGK